MPIYFVSSADGSDLDNGTTLDLAWATLEHAVESGGLSAGDFVAVRRTHAETPGSDVTTAYAGTIENPIIVFGCPRDAHAISSSDWTNGNTGVVVDDADMDREQHQARYITAPDGETYFITRVTDASNIVIDREYAGGTVSNNATASIDADDVEQDWEDYNDSGDTIKKSDWEADADDVPLIDFNDANYGFFDYGGGWQFKNMEWKDTTRNSGLINFGGGQYTVKGCLFKQTTQSDPLSIITGGSNPHFERTTFEGSGGGSNQRAVDHQFGSSGSFSMKDVAVYNMGDAGIKPGGDVYLENVNIGVEISNGDDDILIESAVSIITGRDVKLGGGVGYVSFVKPSSGLSGSKVSIENFQKVLGDHRTFYSGGYYEKAAVAGETPNQKVSADVLKIVPNVNQVPQIDFPGYVMLIHELEMTAASHTLKYWIYNDSGATLNDTTAKDDIYLKAEYIKAYDDTSEYVMGEVFSSQIDILDAADADDWDYLEVTITPDIAGKVRLIIYLRTYFAATHIFIDPAVVIS